MTVKKTVSLTEKNDKYIRKVWAKFVEKGFNYRYSATLQRILDLCEEKQLFV